jgi:hypothetical protein
MNTKRHALSLAAVLAATVLAGGAAVLGVVHRPPASVAQPALVQSAQPTQPAAQHWEEGD